MWQYNQTVRNDELMHYGVVGMKWGKRKSLPTSSTRANFDKAKANRKAANKAFNKSYNKASGIRNLAAFSPSKKARQNNDKRWNDAYDKAADYRTANAAYKKAKSQRKTAIKSTTEKINSKASLGEKLTYNSATRKKAAKYVVDNNMSMADANKKAKGEAVRNTAIMLGAYGAVAVGTLAYKKFK